VNDAQPEFSDALRGEAEFVELSREALFNAPTRGRAAVTTQLTPENGFPFAGIRVNACALTLFSGYLRILVLLDQVSGETLKAAWKTTLEVRYWTLPGFPPQALGESSTRGEVTGPVTARLF